MVAAVAPKDPPTFLSLSQEPSCRSSLQYAGCDDLEKRACRCECTDQRLRRRSLHVEVVVEACGSHLQLGVPPAVLQQKPRLLEVDTAEDVAQSLERTLSSEPSNGAGYPGCGSSPFPMLKGLVSCPSAGGECCPVELYAELFWNQKVTNRFHWLLCG